VFGERLKDRAGVVTFGAHPEARLALLQVCRKLAFKLSQLGNLLPHRAQLGYEHIAYMGTGFHLFALQQQEFADFSKGKAQFLSAADETDMLQILPAEKTESAFSPRRWFKQPLFLVETNGIDSQPGFPCYLSDMKPLRHPSQCQGYTLESTPESSETVIRRAVSPFSGREVGFPDKWLRLPLAAGS
jgi:hypothetical protein